LLIQTPTTLGSGLNALCIEQKLECSGTDLVAGEPLPQMVVEGSLHAVVSHLLEGTGINFEISRDQAGAVSKLALLGHAPAGTSVQSASSVSSRKPPSEYVPPPVAPTDSFASDSQPVVADTGVDTSDSQPLAARTPAQYAMEMMYAGGNASEVTPSPYQPFPDANGNPIPSKPSSGEYLPFPDANGNPIPVKPAQVGSPFPIPQATNTSH